ncbi:hypothetical protein [Agriterribacter sp.]|uniref:hypothetical protein n=1 Tax=Agriterribacter sp. TaxID=2821509 RepID=UPI002CB630C8|nr:hypothetical protein [Agriterribacter sp.]HTN07529.1 hypothetical protein [Agriterribacter sp.]
MKPFKKIILLFAVTFASLQIYAQRIRVVEGKVPDLKNEKSVNTEFTYDNIGVGKFDKEADYIKTKTEEYNKKEAGKGDSWAKKWVDDREYRFQPKFDELFTKYSDLTIDNSAKYTIIFHTTFMEPGFNIGITRKNAFINGEVLIVETANKNKVIAKLSLDKAPGNSFWGNDYDTGERLSETYATAGKALGKFIKK